MVTRKTWEEFRDSKMLWFVNRLLHVFGWAIVTQLNEDGTISEAYPARVKFRGFSEIIEQSGYAGISRYMAENSADLLKEAMEDEEEDGDDETRPA